MQLCDPKPGSTPYKHQRCSGPCWPRQRPTCLRSRSLGLVAASPSSRGVLRPPLRALSPPLVRELRQRWYSWRGGQRAGKAGSNAAGRRLQAAATAAGSVGRALAPDMRAAAAASCRDAAPCCLHRPPTSCGPDFLPALSPHQLRSPNHHSLPSSAVSPPARPHLEVPVVCAVLHHCQRFFPSCRCQQLVCSASNARG